MSVDLQNGFQIGDYEVRPLRGELMGPLGTSHVSPKAMEVLIYLSNNRLMRTMESSWLDSRLHHSPCTPPLRQAKDSNNSSGLPLHHGDSLCLRSPCSIKNRANHSAIEWCVGRARPRDPLRVTLRGGIGVACRQQRPLDRSGLRVSERGRFLCQDTRVGGTTCVMTHDGRHTMACEALPPWRSFSIVPNPGFFIPAINRHFSPTGPCKGHGLPLVFTLFREQPSI